MSPPGDIVLRLEGVAAAWSEGGAEALRGVDLALRAGTFHYLVGPSGAGKTTLLRVMSLSLPARRGRILLFGRDVALAERGELAALRRRIGVVFQDFRLLEHLSVFDNVALPLRIAGLDEDRIAEVVGEMLAWVGLGALAEAPPGQLSMGQRQLVAIARAVVGRPQILLADEPLSNLDPRRAERIMYLFGELHRLGTTVVLATHNMELLRRFPHPLLVMEDGRLVAAGGEARVAAGAQA